jgi:hypothetical protein
MHGCARRRDDAAAPNARVTTRGEKAKPSREAANAAERRTRWRLEFLIYDKYRLFHDDFESYLSTDGISRERGE